MIIPRANDDGRLLIISSLFKSSMIASGPFAIADAAEVFKGEEHSSIEYFIGIFRTHIIVIYMIFEGKEI